jgi:hypothetical protein
MRLLSTRLLALSLLLAAPVLAQEVAEDPDLAGPDVSVGGLVQTQFNTSGQDGADATELLLRRVRLSANARPSDVVSGRIQTELAGAAEDGSDELFASRAQVQIAF